MTSRRRHRPPWLLARTVLAAVVSAALVLTGITQLYVEETNHPLAVPGGLEFVRTGGYLTRFQAWGASSPTPVVLVHGAFESVAYWVPLASRLAGSVHVEAYDVKGYGYTDHVGPYTTEALAQQLDDFIIARHLRHPVLVGHSLGAGIIARFILDHPRVAAGVVMLDGDGLSVSFPGRQVLSIIPDLFKTALFRFVVRDDFIVRKVFAVACGPDCAPLTTPQLRAVERPFEVAGAQQSIFAFASRPIVGVSTHDEQMMARLRIPTEVVYGANDFQFSSAAARETARRLGAPSPIVIRRAGHLSMWAQPAQVARVIERFVASIPRH